MELTMDQLQHTANTLIEALPYIRQWSGKTVVIKYGGHAMTDDALKRSVAEDIVLLRYVGINVVVVHGGGPMITKMMDRLGCEAKFVCGLRVTDADTMDVAQMVLVGLINQELVSLINTCGGKAVGLSGKDANLLRAEKLIHPEGDLGFVGKVIAIDQSVINSLTRDGHVVVVSSVGVGAQGESYNINADTVAGELAGALKAEKLITLSDVKGILRDVKDESSLISRLELHEARDLMTSDIISKGMIPKVESCVLALERGVKRAHMIDGRIPHSILMELFTDQGIGTMIEGDPSLWSGE
ncbi:MAG: acetylglutamate kinase [Armatimonadetes bacterium]|nr:acetylglutamate kinase [Armatimonadota bacterium]